MSFKNTNRFLKTSGFFMFIPQKHPFGKVFAKAAFARRLIVWAIHSVCGLELMKQQKA